MNTFTHRFFSIWNDDNSRRLYLFGIVSAILFKLWLLGANELYIHYSPHDGGLFIRLAHFILNGEWLGPYDSRTLIKGPVYPLFIAATYLFRIPLLFAQHVLYCFAALLFTHVLSTVLKNRLLQFLAFIFILFNPFSSDYPLFYIPYRMGLYVPLVVIFFSTLIETCFPRKVSFSYSACWSLFLGLAFSLLWYTREESVWVVPALIFAFICFILPLQKKQISFVKRLVVVTIPLVIWGITTLTFMHLNEHHYGVRDIIDIKSDSFTSAYGGLLHIENDKPQAGIIITKEMREKAYKVSPSLYKLYPYLDGEKKRDWQNSFIIWSLRRGAQMGNFIENAHQANEFWSKIGVELKTACDDKRLECVRSKPSIRPIWHPEFNNIALGEFWEILRTVTEFKNVNNSDESFMSNGTGEMMWNYIHVTGELYLPSERRFISSYPQFHKEMKARHLYILSKIANIYEVVTPIAFWLSLIGVIYLLYSTINQRRFYFGLVPILTLLGSLFVIIVMLTFVKITVWEVSRPIHSGYPLILLFICYTAACIKKNGQNLREIRTNPR
ncbi:MAG: hypothetical protein ACI8ZB_004151 [Desulforhopalus sp.]|jgi:hypothetical protein